MYEKMGKKNKEQGVGLAFLKAIFEQLRFMWNFFQNDQLN